MTIQLECTDDGSGVILARSGVVNGDDVVSAMRAVLADPQFSAVKYWISDRPDCTRYAVSSEQVAEITKVTR